MKKVIWKFLKPISALSFILTPIITISSCSSLLGSNGAYDSVDDGKIVIQSTWSASGKPMEALKSLAHKYNSSQKDRSGFMPVVIEHIEGGYGTIPSQAITKIQSHDTRTLPNLYIDYPSAVGQIVPYKMAFDVSDTVSRSLFLSDFVKVNDNIAGIDSGKLYSVPLSKSTEALAVNMPLLKYIFDQLRSHGATFSPKTPNDIINRIDKQTISKYDLKSIKKEWGTIFANSSANNIIISDAIFNGYKQLFNFVSQSQKLFSAPGKPNMLSIDSISNSIYQLSSLKKLNNKNDFLFTKNKDTGFIDFKFLKPGTDQMKTFKESYKMIQDLIDARSIWIGGGGAYSSTRLQKHQTAISIASTAGLYKSYSPSKYKGDLNFSETLFLPPINKLNEYGGEHIENINGSDVDLNNVTATSTQGPSFNTIHISPKEDLATKTFLKWFYTSKDGASMIDSKNPIDYFSSASSYIVPLKHSLESNSIIAKAINSKYLSGPMLGAKVSFNTIKREIDNIKKNPQFATMLSIPADDSTGAIREMIDSNISASLNSRNNGSNSYSPQQLLENIRKQSVIDQIIKGDKSQSTYNYPNMMNRNFSDINWKKYSYVDAIITDWIDGDTPKVKVISNSGHDSVKTLTSNSKLSIRIQGIDTPEAHVRLGDLKYRDSDGKMVGFTDKQMKEVINRYWNIHKPLAVYSWGHLNTLKYNPNDKYAKYNYWKNIYVDIQTTEDGKPYDRIFKDPKHLDYTYNFRDVMVKVDNGREVNLISHSAKKEGYWGLKAGLLGKKEMPKGTKVRIATDGRKSYNRIVGSIFYGSNLSKNWSVEILKKGLTLPFLSNPAMVLDKTSILYHNGLAIADAFNFAMKNKKGIFKLDSGENSLNEHFKNILSTHGATDYSPLINYGPNKPIGLPTDIYQYMRTRKDDRTLYRDLSERIE